MCVKIYPVSVIHKKISLSLVRILIQFLPYGISDSLTHIFWYFVQDTGLHYDRYLKEVVMTLEEDPEFRKKLEEANVTDIKVFKKFFLYNISLKIRESYG